MRQFTELAMMSSAKWLSERPGIADLEAFGFARFWDDVNVEGLKNLIRIGICYGFIHLDFDFIYLSNLTLFPMHRTYCERSRNDRKCQHEERGSNEEKRLLATVKT